MADNRRLTRREINRILRKVHGSKRELAKRTGKYSVQCVCHWLHYRMNSHVIEAHAQEFALTLAASLGLTHDETYFDTKPERPLKRKGPAPACRVSRGSLLASA